MGFCLKILTNLSVPSVIFADATWYGSIRGGLTFGAGDDARFMDGGSRWGVKGSNELADGLSAIYQFEHKFSTENAGMDGGGRLAHVGLSGGFGTVTFGQIWSASFNATGAITDNSMLWGDSGTSYRVDNALSYSNSVGNASVQIDAIMDSSRDTGEAVDQVEFGMSIGLGDIGKLAFGYVESKDTNIDDAWVHVPATAATPGVAQRKGSPAEYYLVGPEEDGSDNKALMMIEVLVPLGDTDEATDAIENPYFDDEGEYKAAVAGEGNEATPRGEQALVNNIRVMGGKHVVTYMDAQGDAMAVNSKYCDVDEGDDPTCKTVTVYVSTSDATTVASDGSPTNVERITTTSGNVDETYYIVVDGKGNDDGLVSAGDKDGEFGMVAAVPEVLATPYIPGTPADVEEDGAPNIDPGYKGTHVAAEFGLGGVTAFVGYSSTENNGGALVKPETAPATGDVVRGADGMLARTGSSETKMAHLGVRGSLGDGGMNYVLQYRSVDKAGAKSSPFMFHMSKSLGDGASAHIEHANNDDGKGGKTWLGLKVGF